MDTVVIEFIDWLHGLPISVMTLFMVVITFAGQLCLGRLFGLNGLAVWVVLAIVIANIQVLKVVQAEFLSSPVALGTVMFASTYLCTDLINEVYGPRKARQIVYLGFAAYLFWAVILILTLGYRPLSENEAGDGYGWALGMQDALAGVLTPAPLFFVAGMASYLVSQSLDITLFSALKKRFGGSKLWLRNTVSTSVSALIDSTIFSLLAFSLLTSQPVPLEELVTTYILATWLLRVVLSVIDTPFMYLGRQVLSRHST